VNAPRDASRRMQPLAMLRLRLTAWYAATFCLILAMLGGGLYLTMRSQVQRDLDASLRNAADELARAARIREMEAGSGSGRVMDAVDELPLLDRTLYLLASAGRPLKPDTAADWIPSAATTAPAPSLALCPTLTPDVIVAAAGGLEAGRVRETIVSGAGQDDVTSNIRTSLMVYLNALDASWPVPFGPENYQERVRGALALVLNLPSNQLH